MTAEASGASLLMESNAARLRAPGRGCRSRNRLSGSRRERRHTLLRVALRVVCGDAVRQVIPHVAPANGATVSSKTRRMRVERSAALASV